MENISIESVSKRFEEHLAIPNNNRIIFSGKFGIGKTWFLNEFFKEREETYNKILISPVNYAVSSNEDIFELIKADIIKDLFLTGKVDLKHLPEDNNLQKLAGFVEDKQIVLGKFLLNTLAKLTPAIETPTKIIAALGNIFKGYDKKIKKDYEKTLSEEVVEYLYEKNEKIGNIYEHNYVTHAINVFLEEIRKKGKRKNVLIIDDLDRIDPEHIFRILNVLSAHNNQLGEANKFLFDYILIVCDIENIKKIYYHKYGIGVDFDGFIDKFFSRDIFYFKNEDAIKLYLHATVTKGENFLISKHYLSFAFLLIENLVEFGLLPLRKLMKHNAVVNVEEFIIWQENLSTKKLMYRFSAHDFLKDFGEFYTNSKDLTILYLFKLLAVVFGDFETFYDKLFQLKREQVILSFNRNKDAIGYLLMQKHIVAKSGRELFFQVFGHNHHDTLVVDRIYPPELDFGGRRYVVRLKWNRDEKYSGQSSYFDDAYAELVESNTMPNGDTITLTYLIDTLIDVIKICRTKGFFKNAGIYFVDSSN